jgi:hypothetical protein
MMTGNHSGAQSSGFVHLRSHNIGARYVGQHLTQEVTNTHTAVHFNAASVLTHECQYVIGLKGDSFESGPH